MQDKSETSYGVIQTKIVQNSNMEIDEFIESVIQQHAMNVNSTTLQALKKQMLSSQLSDEACLTIIRYLNLLLDQADNGQCFNIAVEVFVRSGQFWQLQPDSLLFFHQLKSSSNELLDSLLQELRVLCEPEQQHLFLKAHHIDAVIDLLQRQEAIKDDIEQLLQTYLATQSSNIKAIIDSFRKAHLPEIVTQSRRANLIHHTINHAFEITVRTMQAADKLNLFGKELHDVFLKQITRLAIECHDRVQDEPGIYMTVEQASAALVKNGLNTALDAPEGIKNLIAFVVDSIIVLGTTMIYSPVRTMDLSELFFIFEEKKHLAQLPTMQPLNRELMQKLQVLTIITGVCDKTPAAIYDVVKWQSHQEQTDSLHNLQLYSNSSMLDAFFKSGKFHDYYPQKSFEDNAQAFLMALVPHMCMRTELNVRKQPEMASVFINFVRVCQKQHTNIATIAEYVEFFNQQFAASNVSAAMESLFFSNVDGEVDFLESQRASLGFNQQKLVELGQIKEQEGDTQLFIDSSVPDTDAKNLLALRQFYQQLNSSDKQTLIKELMLNTVLQAGAIYVQNQTLGASSQPTTPINCSTPAKRIRASQLSGSFYNTREHSSVGSQLGLLNKEPVENDAELPAQVAEVRESSFKSCA